MNTSNETINVLIIWADDNQVEIITNPADFGMVADWCEERDIFCEVKTFFNDGQNMSVYFSSRGISYKLYNSFDEYIHNAWVSYSIATAPEPAPAPARRPVMTIKLDKGRRTVTGLRYLESIAKITDRSDGWTGTGRNTRNTFVYTGCQPMLIHEAFEHVVSVIEKDLKLKVELVFGTGEFYKRIDYV